MKFQEYVWPGNAVTFRVDGATVEFVRYMDEGMTVIGFDSQMCVPPEPMVNAMLALSYIKDGSTKVIMVNHRSPVGLLAKIGSNFEITEEKLGGEAVKLTFCYKEGSTEQADLTKSHCGG